MGFEINKETIGLVAGVCGLIATTWTAFTWIQTGRAEYSPVVKEIVLKQVEQSHRLDRTDRDRDRFQTNIKELSEKTGDLTEAIVRLNTTIELQSVERKRATDDSAPLLPSRSPAAINPERRK
jgi:F420-0:gamma-glutamyl ligase-like protein